MSISPFSSRSVHFQHYSYTSQRQIQAAVSVNNKQEIEVRLKTHRNVMEKLIIHNPSDLPRLLTSRIQYGNVVTQPEQELIGELEQDVLDAAFDILTRSLKEVRERLTTHKTELSNKFWTYWIAWVADAICGTSRGMKSAIQTLETQQTHYHNVLVKCTE